VSGDNVALNANRHFSALGIKCPSEFDFSFFQGIVKDFGRSSAIKNETENQKEKQEQK